MGEKSGPKLLDLMIPKGKEFMGGSEERKQGSSCVSDERKLELRLGLPCEEDWSNKSGRERKESLLSLNYYSSNGGGGGIGCGQDQKTHHNHHHHPWSGGGSCCSVYQLQQQQQKLQQQQQKQQYLNNGKQMSVVGKDGSSQGCSTRMAELQNSEKKAFSPPSANTAVPNTSQKRAAPTPVVGWPPIRSFRKNLASSSSSKAIAETQSVIPSKSAVNEKKPAPNSSDKGLFVKINMDGIPIGRKVDLNAYNCYENLSSAVDTLFRGLLAAQRDSSGGGTDNKQEEQKPITGLLDGTGEYTLVYEDNEGDRMLVGDVPWHMFVSTVKRLRVLKSSDLPTLCRNGSKQGKMIVERAPK